MMSDWRVTSDQMVAQTRLLTKRFVGKPCPFRSSLKQCRYRDCPFEGTIGQPSAAKGNWLFPRS